MSKLKPKSKRLDWAKYTDFRSHHSKKDLSKLCANLDRRRVKEVLCSPDDVGLLPIHWAAINNRSDLIEFMFDSGSPLRAKCRNKLFADGTALHLAAMNGSIEAASMLLSKCGQLERSQTRPKTQGRPQSDSAQEVESRETEVSSWLNERDSDGQTPLMRSAAPRSKRLDTVRDLLRKNLWSLSGRPAEMALFLINAGADWRQTDTKYGMNLMHWAIANDYDDIVNMLLIIDKQLLTVNARLAPVIEKQPPPPEVRTHKSKVPPASGKTVADSADLESIDLNETTSASLGGKSEQKRPLLKQTRHDELGQRLTAEGLSPLQLAIVYGRVGVINLLWLLTNNSRTGSSTTLINDKQQKTTSSTRWSQRKELRDILIRAYWANKTELGRLMRSSMLRLALAMDLTILTLIYMPVYLTNYSTNTTSQRSTVFEVRSGAFIVSYCLSLALAFRVMLKNPGFLRRSSIQYLSELTLLVNRKGAQSQQPTPINGNTTNITNETLPNDLGGAINEDSKIAKSLPQSNRQEMVSDRKQVRLIVPTKVDNNGETRTSTQLEVTERVRLLCHKCRCVRRPRSRHCNYCNHCVQEFDHHCIYLGCCIGRENRFDFLLLMIAVSLTAIYGTTLYSTSLERHQFGHFSRFIGLIWIFKYVIIGTLSAFFILRRACLGVTMFEQIRSNRIRRIFGRYGPPDDISKSHKIYSTEKGSFWRYAPDRFITGDLPLKKVMHNFKEFTSYASFGDYFLAMACSDTALARSLTSSDSKVDLYKFV